ncbi:hypothetical protein PIPA1_47740 [Pelosinus sp. IPA-1]|nr:hypothetical protein PIPA1_47740 [Pelosinus sp. IPA-1]
MHGIRKGKSTTRSFRKMPVTIDDCTVDPDRERRKNIKLPSMDFFVPDIEFQRDE